MIAKSLILILILAANTHNVEVVLWLCVIWLVLGFIDAMLEPCEGV